MVQGAFRLVADRRCNSAPLKDRFVKSGFSEVRSQEALEEEHEWRTRLQAKGTLAREDAAKIAFEGIEERKGFGGADEIVIAAKADGMAVAAKGNIVDQFKTRFTVEIGVAPVYPGREGVGNFEVWLRRDRREIKRSPSKLHTQLIHQLGVEYGSEGAGNRLITIEIVLERGRQVEPVIERRLIQQTAIIDEIAYKKILVCSDTTIKADKTVVGVIRAEDAAEIRLDRQVEGSLEIVDGRNVGENGGIVEWRFAAALRLVVCVQEGLILLNRPAHRRAELVLSEDVCPACLQQIDSVECIVPEVLVEAPVPVVGSALSDDIYD